MGKPTSNFLSPSIKGKIRPCGYKSLRGKRLPKLLKSTPIREQAFLSRESCKFAPIKTKPPRPKGSQLRSTLLTCKSLRKSQRKETKYPTQFYQGKVLCPLV